MTDLQQEAEARLSKLHLERTMGAEMWGEPTGTSGFDADIAFITGLLAALSAADARAAQAEQELQALREVISPKSGLTGKGLIALAQAHRQDSEDRDEAEAVREALRAKVADEVRAMRERSDEADQRQREYQGTDLGAWWQGVRDELRKQADSLSAHLTDPSAE